MLFRSLVRKKPQLFWERVPVDDFRFFSDFTEGQGERKPGPDGVPFRIDVAGDQKGFFLLENRRRLLKTHAGPHQGRTRHLQGGTQGGTLHVLHVLHLMDKGLFGIIT